MSYLLRTCPACAAPLADDAPRCVRCRTRYCSATCQHDHWRCGHKQICKKIHRGGNAEQYHADKKYKEAVAVAVEACAADLENARGKLECAEKVLRFAVGTRVECSVAGLGGWHKGRVVKHWYRESDMPPGLFMPYQIELDRGGLIMACRDDDKMIRRAID